MSPAPVANSGDNWLSNRPIQTKLALCFGLVLLIFIAALLLLLDGLKNQAEARQLTIHTYRVIEQANTSQLAIREMQVAMRGFLLKGQEEELKLYQSSLQKFAVAHQQLLALSLDNPEQQARITKAAAMQAAYVREVTTPGIAQVREAVKLEGAQRVAALQAAAQAVLSGALLKATAIVDLISDIQLAESKVLEARTSTLEAVVVRMRMLLLLALLLAIAITAVALFIASRQITAPIVGITRLMARLTEGDHGIEIVGQNRRDELGAIARALQQFKSLAIETQRSNWVKTHAGEVSGRLQQAASQREFAEILTASVTPLVKAGVSVFYAADAEGESLELLGSYGYKQRRHVSSRYALGEGLVGQCARERKAIILETVPEDYTRIHSGSGEALPTTVIVLPVMLLNRLLGVLEFASFGRFEEQHQKLLDELLPVIALSLENLSRALRTQQLLQETQAQSEELQASEEAMRTQQEELRASNEALQAQTSLLQQQSARLQASEEELRVQSEELQASNEELRQKGDLLTEQKKSLESLQTETQEKADELARASQFKSDFLANMSHELRTPLNSLLILSRGLADNETGNLSADEVESAQVIYESGANLLRLINDILDLSKVEAGKMELALEDLPLADFSATLLRNFRHVAKEKSLGFEVHIEPGLPAAIHTDPGKLEQVLNNLLSNAFKFTREGSVEVLIGRPKKGLARESDIAIQVRDTGIGIPQEKFDKVFQAFEQVDAGTSRQFGGTGLGLSIARGMVQLMGGDIKVSSEAGKGSCFTVLLPERSPSAMAPPEVPERPPLPRAAAPSQPRPAAISIDDDRAAVQAGDTAILIIEDDPAFARILVDMVRRKGHRALAAADGESGLELAGRFRPAGILLDVMLPGMDGWTVIERLKSTAVTRHIPVHFISATEDKARGLDLGAVGFLTKPVSREGLNSAFERLMHFAAGHTRRVLVVDDDSASRLAVKKLLAGDDIQIVEAEGGEAALAAIESQEIDCIVLDLGMPGMNGFEFLEQASARGPVPPVVVYSGHELSREESLRLRQYTDSIVIKGVRSPERLLDEVSLFLHSIREAPARTAAAENDRTLSGRLVLLVDDDMRNIFALSKALRAKGLNVLMAQDGHKALKQLSDNTGIELVLMDIMMPGMDGYQTMREIRKRPALAKLPIVALTAKAMRGDREKCLDAGANDYLSKPIDLDKLFSMMRVWLSRA